ncbi:MAG TPA: glycosyltransferase, partial [Terriglobales bacterium]|nr:glycosyltransferase [Terriglobales bacterium]
AHNLAKQLVGRGHEVRVITNRYPIALPAKETIDDVRVERLLFLRPQFEQLRQNRPDLFLASLYFGPESYRRLRNVFKGFRPDVVNVHFPDRQIPYVLKLRRQFKFRLVVSLHGHDVERVLNLNGLRNGTRAAALHSLRAILKEANAVTAVSRDLLHKAGHVEPEISTKSTVINNGIEPASYEHKESYQHPRPYIFGVGRLVHKKGFDLLIEAFARVASEARLDLIIAGSGEERHALDRQVQERNLNGRVHFFSEASAEEVVKLMNGCVGVVIPSRTESFGIAALEAVAAGKPVLATKTGGLEEFLIELKTQSRVPEQNGHRQITLVEATVQGIADGMTTMLECRESRVNGPSGVPEKFTWPHIASRYEQVLLAKADLN